MALPLRGRRPAIAFALLAWWDASHLVAEEPWAKACAAIDAYALDSMAREGTPGLQLAVTDRNVTRCSSSHGFADLRLGRPVSQTTLFQIGSISKSFTALALLQLADEGRFDPMAPVVETLPWFEVQTAFAPIAAHHLLTHTAGIPANRDDVPGSPYMAYALRGQATAWPPGSRFAYSNIGYQVLSAMLERLENREYGEIIQTRLLAPLEMRDSRPVITLESRDRQAVGYIPPYDDRPHHPSRALAEAPFFGYEVGDGALQSTAADMARYVRMLLHGGALPSGSRLVSEEAFARFSAPQAKDGEQAYGYGIRVVHGDGGRTLGHSGGMVGHHTRIVADLDHGVGVASLANGPADQGRIVDYALAVARATASGSPVPAPPAPAVPSAGHPLGDYSGSYLGAELGPWRLTVEGSALRLDVGGHSATLEPWGEDLFYTPTAPFDRYVVAFQRGDDGKVFALWHGPGELRRDVAERPPPPSAILELRPFEGRYRSYSPWLPTFEIYQHNGRLMLLAGEGGETTSGETELFPLAPGRFRIGAEPSPEVLEFEDVVDGRALRAVYSGHPFFRSPR